MPKGRPKLAPKEIDDRKNTIIAIAKRLFLDEGYQAVSMRKIASEAQLSPMTLYKVFANKRDILRYIWSDIFSEVSQHCLASSAQAESDRDKFRAFCQAFLRYWLNHPEHYRVVFLESDQLESKDDHYFVEDEIVLDLFEQLEIRVRMIASEEVDVPNKVKLLVLQMLGIAHGLITISEMPWGDGDRLLAANLSIFEAAL